jgi:UDP:flavonoid glycosyltransferase YjiC (YdhE family)
MRILFCPYPSTSGTWGSAIYLLAIADAARRRGHEVVFSACPPVAGLIRAQGYDVRHFSGVDPVWASNDIRDIYDVYDSLGLAERVKWQELIHHELALLKDVRPDLVVTDMRPTAVISAKASNIPVVSLASVGTSPILQSRPARHVLDDISASLAREFADLEVSHFPELIYDRSDAKIATSFPEFEPELAAQGDIGFVGYLAQESAGYETAESLPPIPDHLFLVYLSTVGWSSAAMLRALERCAQLADVDIWCVTRANGQVGTLGDRLRLFSYLPMDALLPRADGLMFHGGQGTAMASLYHGVPSVVCPGTNWERAYNADKLDGLGCGRRLQLMDLRPRQLSAHVLESLALRDTADLRSAQTKVRALPGADGAVDIMERTRAVY